MSNNPTEVEFELCQSVRAEGPCHHEQTTHVTEEETGAETERDLPKITQPVGDRARTKTRIPRPAALKNRAGFAS